MKKRSVQTEFLLDMLDIMNEDLCLPFPVQPGHLPDNGQLSAEFTDCNAFKNEIGFGGEWRQQLPVQFTCKSPDHFEAMDLLFMLSNHLQNLSSYYTPSCEYTWTGSRILSPPVFEGTDDEGNAIYSCVVLNELQIF